ncbi:hypothetical protein ACGFS9_24885 [Streptomyces sp. NPDC048566]|uniref:hypothetical protein n=1 Tax=Streptomyces sp. NPDC048566 TaxID=3365569 RepID=UPI00371F8C9D
MGTTTVDENGAGSGAAAPRDDRAADATGNEAAAPHEVTATAAGRDGAAPADEAGAADTGTGRNEAGAPEDDGTPAVQPEGDEPAGAGPAGVGQGAAAVVSAALGVVSLTGSWVSTVAAARETLIGQLRTSSSASVAQQVKAVYGDAWATTALIGGLFALAALIVGVVVLVRPAFGAPGRPQAAWIKSVAWAGVSLGVIGLVLAVAKYTDLLLGLPSAG